MRQNWVKMWLLSIASIFVFAVLYGVLSVTQTMKQFSTQTIDFILTSNKKVVTTFPNENGFNSNDQIVINSTEANGDRYLWVYDTKNKKLVTYRFIRDGIKYQKGEKQFEQVLE